MEKIAVIGLSCLFPGARTPQEYWRNLMEGKDLTAPATDENVGVNLREYYNPRAKDYYLQKSNEEELREKLYCKRGGYVHDFDMDPTGFQLSAEFVRTLDDVVQWPLYAAREALKDSGYWRNAEALARCGLTIANLSFPTKSSNHLFFALYLETIESCLQELLGDTNFRLAPSPFARKVAGHNRRISGYTVAVIAEALSLSETYHSLDAACASSIYSVKLACDYLLTHKADMMLAGAVSAADPLFVLYGFNVFLATPQEWEPSSPLDEGTAGLFPGEGSGMFVLKRYSDAVRDGDRIHAVIRGVGLSNDGKGGSVLSPVTKGQVTALERAYANAEVDPKSIQFVECHATGTELGDRVELNSMDTFFGKHGASPLIGSVKSNMGHLLTAAGMPAMTKVILSMAEGTIPPTINVKKPLSSPNQVIGAGQIPVSPTPWPRHSPVKRAGVSAFGFGGTDAHIIFEHEDAGTSEDARQGHDLSPQRDRQGAERPSPMAIVGMDAHFGSCEGLSAFHRSTCDGVQHFGPLPPNRWKGIEDNSDLLRRFGFEEGKAPGGAYIENFEIDFLHFKIPPKEDDRLIPQQLLAIKVADNALREAQIEQGQNVAVIFGMETELDIHRMKGRANVYSQMMASFPEDDKSLSPEQKRELRTIVMDSVQRQAQPVRYVSFIGNTMATRVASLWDFSGPAFTVSSEENSVFRALQVAQMMLDSGEVEAVVVGGVDLSGGVENVLWRNSENTVNTGDHTLSFAQNVHGWTVGEGAGAVVLKRLDVARRNNERVYASVDAIGFAKGVTQESIAKACQECFGNAEVEAGNIGYLEVFGSGLSHEDEAEVGGLIRGYAAAGPDLTCAIGSVKANIGHTIAASGIASLIKTALCLYHSYIPGTPAWSGPKSSEIWENSPFYVPAESKTWFLEGNQQKRIAAISGLGKDGVSSHVILSEEPSQGSRPSNYLVEKPPFLLPLAGEDQTALQRGLNELRQEMISGSPLASVASRCLARCQQQPDAEYALAVVGGNTDELTQEIDAAWQAVEKAFASGQDWTSPRGSYFTANPLGKKGKIAFVYPGGLNSYVGLGRDLFQLFPQMYEEAAKYTSQLGQMAGERLLYPRSMNRPTKKDLNVLEQELMNTPITMFETGILFAILYTKIARSLFGIEPEMALGYSMGEVSMMHALGVWGETDKMSASLRSSPVFQTRLTGPMEAVRDAWNIPTAEGKDKRIWYAYILRTPPDRAREALEGESRAYLIFINSPNEVIIAGEDCSCKRVIEKLACEHFELPMSNAIHCEIAAQEFEELARIHTLPTNNVTGIDFYSADRFAPLPIDANTIANNIATIYSHEIDFSRLVQQAYEDGARIFIELGPRENCTHWIGENLEERPHLAVGVNRKGMDDKTSLLRTLAKLYSHQVELDLAHLYSKLEVEDSPKKTFIQSIVPGGVRIPSAILNEENRERFKVGLPEPSTKPAVEPLGPSFPVPRVEKVHDAPQKQARVEPARPDVQEHERQAMRSPIPESIPTQSNPFNQNRTLLGSSHSAFLEARREGLQQMREMIQLQVTLAGQAGLSRSDTALSSPRTFAPPPELPQTLPPPPEDAAHGHRLPAATRPPEPLETPEPRGTFSWAELLDRYPPPARAPANRVKPPGVIWDYDDLREFAGGKIANVFGEKYAIIDTYSRCVRLPMEPYLLVSRVTKLDAETGAFRPSSITTEYDIPFNAWYSMNGQIPWAVAVESGQCDLLLISYLGIDFECKGERVYRLLDCTLTFKGDVPREGETLRYDIKINSFARSGGTLLFFFSYDCFVNDELKIEMRGGCAGFFTDEELAAGKGVILTESEIEEKKKIQKKNFSPLLVCDKSRFERADLLELVRGNLTACFGQPYGQGGRNPALHFTAEAMLMIDRVLSVDPRGGAWGLGLIVAEKDMEPDHWYFPCHFKADNVLAGSLVSDGCSQILRFYSYFLGLQTRTKNAHFEPLPNVTQRVRCRGQIVPGDTLITYRLEVKEIGLEPEPYALADVDILLGDKVVVAFNDLGLRLAEQEAGESILEWKPQEPKGTPTYAEMLDRYPPPERKRADEERPPGVILDYADLREFAEGKIANVFGGEYAAIDTYPRRARLPLEPFLFVSRVLNMNAERGELKPCSITTEFDIPENALYAMDGQIPWAIIVEASHCDLLLMGRLGIDFESKGDRVFRLVEATMAFTDSQVFAGDTIRMEVKIHSFVRTGGTLLIFNSYDCYKGDKLIGTMRDGCVGFFTDEQVEGGRGIVLTEAQIEERKGIQKKRFDPLLTCDKSRFERADLLELVRHHDAGCFGPAYDQGNPNPALSFAAEPMLMIDRVVSVDPRGGAWGLGLVVAEKDLAPDHWYFPCHFKDDHVLAGALVGEGCAQVGKFYSLFMGLQTRAKDAVFQPLPSKPQKVRCRGQVTPKDTLLTYRMEVKDIGIAPDPYIIADIDVLLGDKVVVAFQDMGGRLSPLTAKDMGELKARKSVSVQIPREPKADDTDKDALFTKYHLEEFATGSVAKCFGPDFLIYEGRQAPRMPNGDLFLISRVREVEAKRMDLRNPASVVAECDVPEDAWFFRENSHPAVVPYSILMEISLQPNGFIAAHVGTTLTAPDLDFRFRNLDGEGTILRPIDLRGKTITNRSVLLSTVKTKNTILQRFEFELSHDGLAFYRGTASFGYFLQSALDNQIGLDGGVSNNPLQTKEYLTGSSVVHIDLHSKSAREQYYQSKAETPYYHLAGPQLDFLDEVQIVEQGGKYEQGYICGYKKIDPTDWFYPCHFFEDPVMPGSLGVESILQAMQVYALQQDLGAQFQSPQFSQRLNHNLVWKYRGQLIPEDDQMVLEVHIKKVERTPEIVIVLGDASLWKNDIRIYEITDAAICLEEARVE